MIEQMNRNQVLQDWDQILESTQTNEIVFCKQATPLPDLPSSRKSGWPQNRKRKYQYYIEQNRGCNSPGKKQMRQLWQDLQLQYTTSSTQENTESGLQLGPGSPAFGDAKKMTKNRSKCKLAGQKKNRTHVAANGFLLGEALLALLICMISGFLLFSSAGALAKSQSLEIVHEMQTINAAV